VTLNIVLEIRVWTAVHLASIIFFSVFLYLGFIWIIDLFPGDMYKTAWLIFSAPSFYLSVLLNLVVIYIFEMGLVSIKDIGPVLKYRLGYRGDLEDKKEKIEESESESESSDEYSDDSSSPDKEEEKEEELPT
jgi:hypothetical protein